MRHLLEMQSLCIRRRRAARHRLISRRERDASEGVPCLIADSDDHRTVSVVRGGALGEKVCQVHGRVQVVHRDFVELEAIVAPDNHTVFLKFEIESGHGLGRADWQRLPTLLQSWPLTLLSDAAFEACRILVKSDLSAGAAPFRIRGRDSPTAALRQGRRDHTSRYMVTLLWTGPIRG